MKVSTVGVAWYTRESYEKLLPLWADRERFDPSFDKWLDAAERFLDKLRQSGQAFQKVYIDPDTFPEWCARRSLDLNAQARIDFASEFVARGIFPD